jgi:hypothetical protein
MDDKELVIRIRNSFKAKKSRADIIESMIKKGYRLEYTEALIRKAKRPKKILITSIVSSIIIISLLVAVLAVFDDQPTIIGEGIGIALNNPLDGFNVIFGAKPSGTQPTPSNSSDETGEETEIYLEDVAITPEFIAYLLREIGALDTLHKNTITREIPMINFKIEEVEYTATIEDTLQVAEGLSTEADIQFNSDKEAIVKATLSADPAAVFKDSVAAGTTQIETIAGEAELFAKGYLALYDSLK